MAALPESVSKAWEDRKGPAIFATVDESGTPNAIYVTCVSTCGEDTIVVADNYFSKTRQNILAGSRGSVLFMTNAGKTYQIKGTITYHTAGLVFDDMKCWNPAKHPGHAAAALCVEEVYSGAQRIL
jgi:uncharacterized protein